MYQMKHLRSVHSTIDEAAILVRNQMEQYVPLLAAQDLRFDAENLLGACGIASYCLQRVLKRVGIRSDLVMGQYKDNWHNSQHCWVELPYSNLILDVTATQFDIDQKVHRSEPGDPRYMYQNRNRSALNRLRAWEDQSHLSNKVQLDIIVKDCVAQLIDSGYVA
jgi:hypothetical protein